MEHTSVGDMLHMPGNWGWESDVWRLHNAGYIEQMNDPKMLLAKSREAAAKKKNPHAKIRRPEMKSQSPMVISEIEKLEKNPQVKWKLEPGYREHIEDFLWKVPAVAEKVEHYLKAGVGATEIHHQIGEDFGIVLCRSTIDKKLQIYNYAPQPLAIQLAQAIVRLDELTMTIEIMASDITHLKNSVYLAGDDPVHFSSLSVPSSHEHSYSMAGQDSATINKRKYNGYTATSKHHSLDKDHKFPDPISMSEEIRASTGLYTLASSTNTYGTPIGQDSMSVYGQSPASLFPMSNPGSPNMYEQHVSPFGNLNSYQPSQSNNATTPYLQLMDATDSPRYNEAFSSRLSQPQSYSEVAPLHLRQSLQDNQVLKDCQIQPHMPQQTRAWLSNTATGPVHQPFAQANFVAQTRAEQSLPYSTSLSTGNLKPSNPEKRSSPRNSRLP